jgi:hypothetical protein
MGFVHRPKPCSLRFLGNVEAWLSIACTGFVLFTPTTVADRFRVPWIWMTLWAVGAGAGLGGLRFGNSVAKIAGGTSVVLLLGFSGLLMTLRGVPEWESIWDYWSGRF